MCFTVSSCAVVATAVVDLELSDGEGEEVFTGLDGGLEAPLVLLELFDDEFQRSSGLLLSVPQHRVAAHADAGTHAAIQRHRRSQGNDRITRLENLHRQTCSA